MNEMQPKTGVFSVKSAQMHGFVQKMQAICIFPAKRSEKQPRGFLTAVIIRSAVGIISARPSRRLLPASPWRLPHRPWKGLP